MYARKYLQLTHKLSSDKLVSKLLTGLGLFVLRLSKKALAAAQSVSSPASSARAESFGFISLIFIYNAVKFVCPKTFTDPG